MKNRNIIGQTKKKLKKDLIKISNFYEKILDNLYKKLNLIHKKIFQKILGDFNLGLAI